MSAKAAARRGRHFAALNATRLMTTHRQRLSILKNRRAISCDAREKEARSTRAHARATSHSAFRADRFGGSDAPPDAARGRAEMRSARCFL